MLRRDWTVADTALIVEMPRNAFNNEPCTLVGYVRCFQRFLSHLEPHNQNPSDATLTESILSISYPISDFNFVFEVFIIFLHIVFVNREKCKSFIFYRAMHFSAYARSWDRMSSVCNEKNKTWNIEIDQSIVFVCQLRLSRVNF